MLRSSFMQRITSPARVSPVGPFNYFAPGALANVSKSVAGVLPVRPFNRPALDYARQGIGTLGAFPNDNDAPSRAYRELMSLVTGLENAARSGNSLAFNRTLEYAEKKERELAHAVGKNRMTSSQLNDIWWRVRAAVALARQKKLLTLGAFPNDDPLVYGWTEPVILTGTATVLPQVVVEGERPALNLPLIAGGALLLWLAFKK